jgi:S-formylglutathione hydrolase FrmB
MATGSFPSPGRPAPVRWAVSYPPGAAADRALPVVVVLHGKGGDHRSAFHGLGLDRFQADLIGSGVPAFAVASIDGGATYYHRRRAGTDAGADVTDRLLPELAQRGLDVAKVGLLGWSMGGYGALLLAAQNPRRVAAVATSSAALWERYADSAPGAFDDASDFRAHDVFERRPELSEVPLRVDCGTTDPFISANRAFVAGFDARPAGSFDPGRHTVGYWRRMAPAQLRFLARHLAR